MALNPLHQFEVHEIHLPEGIHLPFMLTNQSLSVILAIGFAIVLFVMGARKRSLIPGRLQAFVELTFEFVRGLVKDTTGKAGLKYLPLVMTVFLFIAFLNLMGMVPGAYTATSQLAITFSMSLSIFALVVLIGFATHGFKFLGMFFPHGTPVWLAPLIVPLELISFFARPFTLAIRLSANMIAGHVLLKIFASFVILLGGWLATAVFPESISFLGAILGGSVPMLAVVAITALEIFVALLQAYIFTVLTCVYLNDALHLH